PFYDYLTRKPVSGALFDRAIVDVGGGNGTLLVELLRTYPRPIGTVFDVPRLAEAAQRTIDAAGLTRRCKFLGGNALESVPAGGDAYLLSNFVISWGDDEALVPLRNCRKVMAATGKLLLVEWIMPTGEGPQHTFRFWDSVTMDLIMLAAFGSRS